MFNEKVTAAEGSNNANVRDLATMVPRRKGSAIDKRASYADLLGSSMKNGGQEIGETTQVGQCMVEVGGTFERIGMLEREYLSDVYTKFFKPFSNHLQVEWGNVTTEKRRLELARLDLDAAKAKVRTARTPEVMQQNEQKAVPVPDLVATQVRESQAAFDRQFEQTKILLTDADRKSGEFCHYLEEFIRSQVRVIIWAWGCNKYNLINREPRF
eukprot:sb/3470093/